MGASRLPLAAGARGWALLQQVQKSLTELAFECGLRLRHGTHWASQQVVEYRFEQPANDARHSIAASSKALPLHSDGSFETKPPDVLLMRCDAVDIAGCGEHLLLGLPELLTHLSPTHMQELTRANYVFCRETPGSSSSVDASILHVASGRHVIRYRTDTYHRILARTPAAESALAALKAAIERSPPTRLALRPGDALVLNNRTVLHGRSALSGTRDRVLSILWADGEFDWDGIDRRKDNHESHD